VSSVLVDREVPGMSGGDLTTPAERLSPGLYRVTTSYLCAGFVVEDGKVARCAPILRRRLSYWLTVAERVNNGPR
jgi:hypothetical protein